LIDTLARRGITPLIPPKANRKVPRACDFASHVPRTMNKHNHANVFVPRPGEPDPADLRIRAGDPLSSQVKVVCGDCNSGWLNRIQEAARPLLLPLFEGSSHTINAVAQAKVSTWIAMATMTGEYMSQDERRVAAAILNPNARVMVAV
jgi:hypothetical protein